MKAVWSRKKPGWKWSGWTGETTGGVKKATTGIIFLSQACVAYFFLYKRFVLRIDGRGFGWDWTKNYEKNKVMDSIHYAHRIQRSFGYFGKIYWRTVKTFGKWWECSNLKMKIISEIIKLLQKLVDIGTLLGRGWDDFLRRSLCGAGYADVRKIVEAKRSLLLTFFLFWSSKEKTK